MEPVYINTAKMLKAMSDPKRLRIVDMLSCGELCGCKILEEFHITQPTLSHDMKVLSEAGIVKQRREGKNIYYSLNTDALSAMHRTLGHMFEDKPDCICHRPEQKELEGNGVNHTKLYVLTGFLGSGKTTVLLELCRRLEGHRIGIIQNELGKISIDGTILRNDDIQMVELNRGSIFCSCLKLNFVKALAEMAQQDFEYLFVESSGWGDPSNVHELINAAKELSQKEYDFGGVICFMDAVNFPEQIKELETAQRQLKHCNLAVITKTDLVDESSVEKVRMLVRDMNPVCEILTSCMGDMDYSFMKKDLTVFQWTSDEESTNTAETKPKTLILEYDGEAEEEKLDRFLEIMAPDTYRMKGFCKLKGRGWTQVDVVGSRIDQKPGEEFACSQLVLISRIGSQIIRPIFAEWEKTVGIPMRLKN